MKRGLLKVAIVSFFVVSLVASAIICARLQKLAVQDRALKKDYFLVNQIKYGLLSGNQWTKQVNDIISARIDSFNLTAENKQVLIEQTNKVLGKLLDELDKKLHEKKESLGDRIKFGLFNALVDIDKFRPEIPRFSRVIVNEIGKTGNKDKIKALLKEKVEAVLAVTNQDTTGEQQSILRTYGFKEIPPFNARIQNQTDNIHEEQRMLSYVMCGILLVVLLVWIIIIKYLILPAQCFLLSVLVSLLAMYTGISLPMIEIDARISRLDLEIMKGHIIFDEQVIFYQAKSILDVVRILVVNGKGDTIFVGALIFIFSVLFPLMKLICTTIYLYKPKKGGFIKFMAFNSGKWSMADVMVVAIFMAYVGFKGILDNQLKDISVSTEQINLITTNKTNLQSGYAVFVGFCIFNLVLAEILKIVTRKRAEGKALVEPHMET